MEFSFLNKNLTVKTNVSDYSFVLYVYIYYLIEDQDTSKYEAFINITMAFDDDRE